MPNDDGSARSTGNDHDKFVEFKAEIKTDLKYLRVDTNKMQESISALTRKVNTQCTEIAVLKAKVAIYAGLIATGVSVIGTIIQLLVRG